MSSSSIHEAYASPPQSQYYVLTLASFCIYWTGHQQMAPAVVEHPEAWPNPRRSDMSRVPRPRSIRNLSAEEEAQLNDELHPHGCDCHACLPEAYDHADASAE